MICDGMVNGRRCHDTATPLDRRNARRHRRSKDKTTTTPLGHAKKALLREPIATSDQIKSAHLGSLIGGAGSGIGARRGVRIPHLGSVWQRHRHELPTIVAVTKRMNDGNNGGQFMTVTLPDGTQMGNPN